MKRLRANMEKFSLAQLTSNSDGKTSGSGTAGLYIVFIGGICFFLGCIDKMFINESVDVLTQSIIFITIGVTLLGYRKSKDSGIENLDKSDDVKEEVEVIEEPKSEDSSENPENFHQINS
jgi:hypothetical protein